MPRRWRARRDNCSALPAPAPPRTAASTAPPSRGPSRYECRKGPKRRNPPCGRLPQSARPTRPSAEAPPPAPLGKTGRPARAAHRPARRRDRRSAAGRCWRRAGRSAPLSPGRCKIHATGRVRPGSAGARRRCPARTPAGRPRSAARARRSRPHAPATPPTTRPARRACSAGKRPPLARRRHPRPARPACRRIDAG